MDYLTDAEYQEEIRAVAVCGEGPNWKSICGDLLRDQADLARKATKEDPEEEPTWPR